MYVNYHRRKPMSAGFKDSRGHAIKKDLFLTTSRILESSTPSSEKDHTEVFASRRGFFSQSTKETIIARVITPPQTVQGNSNIQLPFIPHDLSRYCTPFSGIFPYHVQAFRLYPVGTNPRHCAVDPAVPVYHYPNMMWLSAFSRRLLW
jgi:hypothetical protein